VVLINAPISRQAIDEMRIWARGGSSSTQQNARTSFMSNSIDGGSGFDCGDYASWVDGIGCVHDEEMIVTPEDDWMDDPFFDDESLDEENDNGGFYPPQPGETDCEVSYNCNPDGGGVGPGPVPDPCDGDNPPDYCAEPDLCLGDPLPNPEITPSNGWNVRGGMFGPTRNCDSNGLNCDFHDGIDISAELNTPLYSMHPGTVVERRHPPMDPGEYDRRVRTWGNYVIIESEINGEIIRFRYAHLNEMHVPAGTTVYAGQQIGLTGNTGNAQDNGNIVVLPHVHVQARKVVNGHESKVDPNDYMSTKFNNNGTINTSASSCD